MSKMFEAIASKIYESCPPVEDRELEKKGRGSDAAQPVTDSDHHGEHKAAALPGGASMVTEDVREKPKSVQGESKHCTRVSDSHPKSQTRRDERNGALSRKPESSLQGRNDQSDKLQSGDRLRSRVEMDDLHEQSGKGSWKRPLSPKGQIADSSRLRNQEEEQKKHQQFERVRC